MESAARARAHVCVCMRVHACARTRGREGVVSESPQPALGRSQRGTQCLEPNLPPEASAGGDTVQLRGPLCAQRDGGTWHESRSRRPRRRGRAARAPPRGPSPPAEDSPPAGRERPSVTAAEGEGEAAWSHLVLPVYRRETCGLVTLNARRPNLLPGGTESRPPHSGPPRLRPLPITTSAVGPSAPAPAGGRFRPQSHEGEERGRP